MPEERFKLIAAVYIVIIRDGKVLLIRRANTGHEDGKYGFPAGHLLPGEAVREGAIREAREEIAVSIEPEDLRVVHTMIRKKANTDDGDRIDFFLAANAYSGEPINAEPEKCDDINWFPLEELPENTIAYIRQAIQAIRRKQSFSEFGWN